MNITEHTRRVTARVRGENDNLNAAIMALAGALLSKGSMDQIDLAEEHILVDSSNDNTNDAVIQYLTYEDKELMYGDNDNIEDTPVHALPLDTRLELADKLADLLDA